MPRPIVVLSTFCFWLPMSSVRESLFESTDFRFPRIVDFNSKKQKMRFLNQNYQPSLFCSLTSTSKTFTKWLSSVALSDGLVKCLVFGAPPASDSVFESGTIFERISNRLFESILAVVQKLFPQSAFEVCPKSETKFSFSVPEGGGGDGELLLLLLPTVDKRFFVFGKFNPFFFFPRLICWKSLPHAKFWI